MDEFIKLLDPCLDYVSHEIVIGGSIGAAGGSFLVFFDTTDNMAIEDRYLFIV